MSQVQRVINHAQKYIAIISSNTVKELPAERNIVLPKISDPTASLARYYSMRTVLINAVEYDPKCNLRLLVGRQLSLVKITTFLQCLPRDVNHVLDKRDLYLMCLHWEPYTSAEMKMVLAMPRVINICGG
jgi:hypothetical protein